MTTPSYAKVTRAVRTSGRIRPVLNYGKTDMVLEISRRIKAGALVTKFFAGSETRLTPRPYTLFACKSKNLENCLFGDATSFHAVKNSWAGFDYSRNMSALGQSR